MTSRRTWVAYALTGLLVLVGSWFIVASPLSPTPGARPTVTITLPATVPAEAARADRPFPELTCTDGDPVRLVMPSLGVDAAIERIGLDESAPVDADGRHPLGNPADRTQAGWYADGPRPGSGTGTVLLNGHTFRNGSAIFTEDFSSQVAEGQVIHVRTSSGGTCSYEISRVWRAVEAATEYPRIVTEDHLYDFTGPERLFLATCGGSWNSATQSYDHISMLIASPINRG